MKYFTFGMRELRVTQNYNGITSHRPHWYKSRNYADYPIDVAGKDGNKDTYYATVDMKVVAIKGIGNGMTNTIWLVATEKCMTPSGEMTPFIALTHWNDSDPYIKNLKVGYIVKEGTPICEEGVDGATANHLHMVTGNADRGCGNGLIQNSNGKWVSNGYCMKPEEVMFIDRKFTKEIHGGSLVWKDKPKEVSFLGTKGYLTVGDSGDNIEKICEFMVNKVKGNYFGPYLKTVITEFQRQKGIETDGNIGPITLSKLKEDGFKE